MSVAASRGVIVASRGVIVASRGMSATTAIEELLRR